MQNVEKQTQNSVSQPDSSIQSPIDAVNLTPSGHPEVQIPQELQAVVEKSPDVEILKIEKNMTNTGQSQATVSVPPIATPTGTIHLPLTYAQAQQKTKTTSFWDSLHWLAALVIYQWKKYDPDVIKASKAKTKNG